MLPTVTIPAYSNIPTPDIDVVSDTTIDVEGTPTEVFRLKPAIDQISITKGYLTTITSFVNEPEKTQAETAANNAPAFIQEAANIVTQSKDTVIPNDITTALGVYNPKAQAYRDATAALNDAFELVGTFTTPTGGTGTELDPFVYDRWTRVQQEITARETALSTNKGQAQTVITTILNYFLNTGNNIEADTDSIAAADIGLIDVITPAARDASIVLDPALSAALITLAGSPTGNADVDTLASILKEDADFLATITDPVEIAELKRSTRAPLRPVQVNTSRKSSTATAINTSASRVNTALSNITTQANNIAGIPTQLASLVPIGDALLPKTLSTADINLIVSVYEDIILSQPVSPADFNAVQALTESDLNTL